MVTFDNALRGLRELNASVGERRLVDMLASHGREEGQLLERYQRFASTATSPAARYLVELIIRDEERHHHTLVELANAIAWGWSELSPEPALPDVPYKPSSDPELLAETRELLAAEKRDQHELQKLRKELAPFVDTTVWELVVSLMLLDTQKHALILEFIAEHCVS